MSKRRLFVLLSILDLDIAFMRWLWNSAMHPRERWLRRNTIWAWFVYQVISGYPPGEVDHWEGLPDWLRKNQAWLAPMLHSRNEREGLLALREWWTMGGTKETKYNIPWDRLMKLAR